MPIFPAVGAQVAASANNQTLAAAVGRRTYISGFSLTGGGATLSVTVTGLANTLNYSVAVPAGASVGITPLHLRFHPPLPASADNTPIVVNVPSFGAGNTNASASAWGFQA